MVVKLSRRHFLQQTSRLALATPFINLIGCKNSQALLEHNQLSGATMGTTYQIKISQWPAGLERQKVERDIADILDRINQQMSTYRPGSELSQFNVCDTGRPYNVSEDTLNVVDTALAISRLTDGAFDPSICPLVDLWGFGSGESKHNIPAQNLIDKTLAEIGYQKLLTQPRPAALSKQQQGLRIDLSGIAKGFGVDKVAEYLEHINIEYYLVEIGGELRGRGYSRRGEEWRVGIEKPDGATNNIQRLVHLNGGGLATSGDYRIFFQLGESKYSHILDPRNGHPVGHGLASVTVVADSCMQADGLSTALMVLGAEQGLELCEREKIAAFFISRHAGQFVEIASSAFEPYLIA